MSTPIDLEPTRNESTLSPHQRWQPSSGSTREKRTLPSWESFPLQDRHRLIRLIVQTARRQVQEGRRQQGEEATR